MSFGKKTLSYFLIFVILYCFSGCATLSLTEKNKLNEFKACGIPEDDQKVKHPGLAGVLNILPGFGNFYLAAGTNESEQWLYGFLNLITWPFSPIWAIPEAIIDANSINKRQTVYYYTYDPTGKEELENRCIKSTPKTELTK